MGWTWNWSPPACPLPPMAHAHFPLDGTCHFGLSVPLPPIRSVFPLPGPLVPPGAYLPRFPPNARIRRPFPTLRFPRNAASVSISDSLSPCAPPGLFHFASPRPRPVIPSYHLSALAPLLVRPLVSRLLCLPTLAHRPRNIQSHLSQSQLGVFAIRSGRLRHRSFNFNLNH